MSEQVFESDVRNHAAPYADPSELEWLRQAAATLEGEFVMIGAGPGVMAMAVLEIAPQTPTTIIDVESVDYARAHIESLRVRAERVNYIKADSRAVWARWANESVELLVIDGDHSFGGVTADLIGWCPTVNVGGKVFIHDFEADGTIFAGQERYPGVQRAVRAYLGLVKHFREVERVGTAVILERAE